MIDYEEKEKLQGIFQRQHLPKHPKLNITEV